VNLSFAIHNLTKFAKGMTFATPGEGTKIIVIASGVSSAQHGEVSACFFFSSLFTGYSAQPERVGRFGQLTARRRGVT
jgi:hypothetical protein